MKLVVVAVLAAIGCGRVAFDPLATATTDAAIPGDITLADAPRAACLTNPQYTTVAGLTNRYREGIPLVSWQAARDSCLADGADLWVPDTPQEATALTGDWVGITDVAAEGVWRKVNGELATFLPWNAGQPDGGPAENCARNTGNTFEDRDCTDQRDFVCECPVGS